ncbi:MAG TPA: hypothetical protein VFQ77_05895 [Pseudonocardiaceae bacterium]|nr:hypothetical protein [Pseudonocardiaceae bacterium]
MQTRVELRAASAPPSSWPVSTVPSRRTGGGGPGADCARGAAFAQPCPPQDIPQLLVGR